MPYNTIYSDLFQGKAIVHWRWMCKKHPYVTTFIDTSCLEVWRMLMGVSFGPEPLALSQEEVQFFLCLSTIFKISLACRSFWYMYLHLLTILLEYFRFGFDLEQKLYKKGWPLELYQRCLIWNVTDEPPDNGDHRFSGSPDVPWTIIWPETFREC